jgi:para-aminobenzoate synthetase component 1
VEQLQSLHNAQVPFPELSFFTPDHLIRITDEYWEIESSDPSLPEKILKTIIPSDESSVHTIQSSITKEEYIKRIEKIREHILQGDIFEMNFCQEFKLEASVINPIETYLQLTELSPMPFSCLYKCDDQYLICASPERFIQKTGDKIISQPIKGTAKRSLQPEEDLKIKEQLASSEKERAENIMIVDLVRNDLSRSCEPGTVIVEELCKVYTFRQVHQMISTISGKQRNDVHPSEVIRQAFPMGSMTGAPKVRAMELTEKYEGFRRGIFSGAVGFITPEGDFDFNVVIRSIVYNQKTKQAALYAGSAITWASDAALEYEECLTKADTMFQVLKKTNVE